MSTVQFHIDVPVGPRWRNVDLLRTSILNCLAAIFQNYDFCNTISMIAGELLENAIKYGDWVRTDLSSFKIRVCGDEASVEVEVSNPVRPGDDTWQDVLRTVEHINSFPTPEAAYKARLREVAEQGPGDLTSRLGLARIAYEGNCELDARVEDDHILTVRAISRP